MKHRGNSRYLLDSPFRRWALIAPFHRWALIVFALIVLIMLIALIWG